MPVLNLPLGADGAVVDVIVGPGQNLVRWLRAAGSPLPQSVQLRALVDTGAAGCSVEPGIIAQLGLPRSGIGLINAPALTGFAGTTQHDASLAILNPSAPPLVFHDLSVLSLALGVPMYQVLIGRDVLDHCRLVYDGIARTFELTY